MSTIVRITIFFFILIQFSICISRSILFTPFFGFLFTRFVYYYLDKCFCPQCFVSFRFLFLLNQQQSMEKTERYRHTKSIFVYAAFVSLLLLFFFSSFLNSVRIREYFQLLFISLFLFLYFYFYFELILIKMTICTVTGKKRKKKTIHLWVQ